MLNKNFSFDTIESFDNHISQSIPNYLLIHEIIAGLTEYFIDNDTNVYDLGCSKGTLLNRIAEKTNKSDVNYIGIDISNNLLPKTTTKNNIRFINKDLMSNNLKLSNSSLMFSIFTLQFLPKKNRELMLKRIYNGLNKGGALIITEKIYSRKSIIQDLFTSLYYEFKSKSFTSNEIMSKEKDLRSMMNLMTKKENEEMFRNAGFKTYDTFFQYYNFIGWILIK